MDSTGKENLRDSMWMRSRVIKFSLEDVIDILKSELKLDLVPEITAARFMNRISIAHISIERAMKFLITQSGNDFPNTHDLLCIFKILKKCDPDSAKFLKCAFEDAVCFFRYNLDYPENSHFSSLEQYLSKVGSRAVFIKTRYWEIEEQQINEITNHVSLTYQMHLEVLHALKGLVSDKKTQRKYVTMRVEESIEEALYGALLPLSDKDSNILITNRSWMLRNYKSFSEAISSAIKTNFNIGNLYINQAMKYAYDRLKQSDDNAILYFLKTSKILPPQHKELSVSPCLTWFNNQQSCTIETPSGIPLGIIHQCYDGFWFIECYIPNSQLEYTVASSREDAINYLMKSFVRPVSITIDGQNSTIYLVGEKYIEIRKSPKQIPLTQGNLLSDHRFLKSHESQLSEYEFDLWETSDDIRLGQRIKLRIGWQDDTSSHEKAYEGEVTNIESEKVTLQGKDWDLHT